MPENMSEAGKMMSQARDNVPGNPSSEQVHQAAQMMGHSGGKGNAPDSDNKDT
jgi:hypothetical protein